MEKETDFETDFNLSFNVQSTNVASTFTLQVGDSPFWTATHYAGRVRPTELDEMEVRSELKTVIVNAPAATLVVGGMRVKRSSSIVLAVGGSITIEPPVQAVTVVELRRTNGDPISHITVGPGVGQKEFNLLTFKPEDDAQPGAAPVEREPAAISAS